MSCIKRLHKKARYFYYNQAKTINCVINQCVNLVYVIQ